MDVINFIKLLAKANKTTIKNLGIDIGRGESASFWRTVTSGKIQAKELQKVIESTGEPFVILYRGEKIEIK